MIFKLCKVILQFISYIIYIYIYIYILMKNNFEDLSKWYNLLYLWYEYSVSTWKSDKSLSSMAEGEIRWQFVGFSLHIHKATFVKPEILCSDWSMMRYWLLHIKTCSSPKVFTSALGHFLFITRNKWILTRQGQYTQWRKK